MSFICLRIVDFPDSPAPRSSILLCTSLLALYDTVCARTRRTFRFCGKASQHGSRERSISTGKSAEEKEGRADLMSTRSFLSCASIASFWPFATESSFEPARVGAQRQRSSHSAVRIRTHLRNPFLPRIRQKVLPKRGKRHGVACVTASERRRVEWARRCGSETSKKGRSGKDKGGFRGSSNFQNLRQSLARCVATPRASPPRPRRAPSRDSSSRIAAHAQPNSATRF